MSTNILVAADLHLTDRAEDAYRWEVFDWMERRLLQKDAGYTGWAILGDFTEVKDRHPASLVHAITVRIKRLGAIMAGTLLEGNHDYVDHDEPFFEFLGDVPGVTFIKAPTLLQFGKVKVAAVPHLQAWNDAVKAKIVAVGKRADVVWCHQCFAGAKNEQGGKLEGFDFERFRRCFPRAKAILAGDIHTPQPIGSIGQYVGAPHPVDFGDNYQPRLVAMRGTEVVSLPRSSIRKASLTTPFSTKAKDLFKDYAKGDRVKVTLELARNELHRWDEVATTYRNFCKKAGIELVSVQPRVEANAKLDRAKSSAAKSMSNPVKVLAAYTRARKDIDPRSLRYGFELLAEARKRKMSRSR